MAPARPGRRRSGFSRDPEPVKRSRLKALQHDLIVIGGGINGTGIARDAALRGLNTCLVEQADLCNSTTRWSSRLIHGGLRYLEFGELGLVAESLQEDWMAASSITMHR